SVALGRAGDGRCPPGAGARPRFGYVLDADFCTGRSGLSLRLVERAAPTTRLHSVSNQVGRAPCVLHSPVGGLLRSPGGTFTTRVGQWPRANRRTPRSDLFGDDRRYYVGCLASSAAGWTMEIGRAHV